MSALAGLPLWGWAILTVVAAAVAGIPLWTRLATRGDARMARAARVPQLVAWGDVRCTPAQHARLVQLNAAIGRLNARGEYQARNEASDDFTELLEQCRRQWGTLNG